jgi:hypothetical protein
MHRARLCVGLVLVGCVSAPTTFSSRSAASVEGRPAPAVTLGRALTEEPPAPGATTEGWVGLAAPSADPMAGMHHHHHPGMTMPPPTTGTPTEEAPHAQ